MVVLTTSEPRALSALMNVQRIYGSDLITVGGGKGFTVELEFVSDLLEHYTGSDQYRGLVSGCMGVFDENKIYLHNLLLTPEELMNVPVSERDKNHALSVVYLHEFQELVFEKSDLVPYSEPHLMLSHIGGGIDCVNNYQPVNIKFFSDLQNYYLTLLKRPTETCDHHKLMIKECLITCLKNKSFFTNRY